MANAVTKSTGGIDLDLDLGALGRALWRRRYWVVVPTLVVSALAFVAVNVVTPRYKSEARVLIEGRENVFLRPDAEKNPNESLVGDQEAVANQVQIAMSREVALDVIRKLKLTERPEFDPVQGGVSVVRSVLSIFGISRDPLESSPEQRAMETYFERLQVFAIEKSRVLVIEFQSTDAELAAQVANAVADSYIAHQRQAKQDQSRGASQWLSGEIEKLRPVVAEAEGRVEAFRAKSNLFIGTNNTTLSNQQLGDFNAQVAAARVQRTDAEARAKSIRDLLKKGESIDASDLLNSDIIRRLSEQRATLRAQLAEQSSTLLDGHPRIKELKAQILDIDRQMRMEAEKLARTFENDARQSTARVDALSAYLDGLKKTAGSTNELDAQLRALERESKAQRDLLESYLAKYREATARETIASAPTADARVISRATPSKTPYFPKKLPIIFVAALATMLLSCGIIATGEILRTPGSGSVVAPESQNTPASPTVTASTKVEPPHPALGVPVSAIGDVAKRVLETANQGRRVAVLGISPGTGDVSLAALTFARALSKEKRAILVALPAASPPTAAGGMPGLAVVSSNPRAPGLSDVVRGKAPISAAITRDRLSRLHIVTAGTPAADAAGLTKSMVFLTAIEALARSYDFIVFDAGAASEDMLARVAEIAPRAVMISPQGTTADVSGPCKKLVAAGFRETMIAAATASGKALAA
jgi:polysaccharide biosynthesis transport protein